MSIMSTSNHQKRREDSCTQPKLTNPINTWLQPNANSNEMHQPFQRLSSGSKTVETVFRVRCERTGLKPGVNENAV
jgi:hypothetical protein